MSGTVLAVVAVGVLFLHAFYRVVESQWPASYYSVGRALDRRISAHPLSYVLFRFGPMYVTGAFGAVVLGRAGDPVVVPIVALGALHAGLTAFRALGALGRQRRLAVRPLAAAVHLAIGVGLVGTAGLAGATGHVFADAVPPSAELGSALVTAVVAGVTGAYLVRVTRGDEDDPDLAMELSRQAIPDNLWHHAASRAEAAGAETRLLQAFLLAENLQRPAWTRAVERLVGRVAGRGTYGPLQHRGNRPVSDLASLEQAIDDRFRLQRVPMVPGYSGLEPDRTWITLFARAYNDDESYAESVTFAYDWLDFDRSSTSIVHAEERAADRLPVVEIHDVRRADGQVTISGSVVAHEANVIIAELDPSGAPVHTSFTTATAGGPERGHFTAVVRPVEPAITLEIGDEVVTGDAERDSARRVRIPIALPASERRQ